MLEILCQGIEIMVQGNEAFGLICLPRFYAYCGLFITSCLFGLHGLSHYILLHPAAEGHWQEAITQTGLRVPSVQGLQSVGHLLEDPLSHLGAHVQPRALSLVTGVVDDLELVCGSLTQLQAAGVDLVDAFPIDGHRIDHLFDVEVEQLVIEEIVE